jgi:MFS family permease
MDTSSAPPSIQAFPRTVMLLLNVAHALDHMFLLIFATAVSTIAVEFGFARWEDLMPYGVGAFFLFGIGALPSGRLGDLWGRRRMMLCSSSEWAPRRC